MTADKRGSDHPEEPSGKAGGLPHPGDASGFGKLLDIRWITTIKNTH